MGLYWRKSLYFIGIHINFNYTDKMHIILTKKKTGNKNQEESKCTPHLFSQKAAIQKEQRSKKDSKHVENKEKNGKYKYKSVITNFHYT